MRKGNESAGFGVNAKLVGLLLPTVAVVLGVILLLVYSNVSAIVLKKSEELLSSNSDSVVNDVSTWMSEAVTALETERDALEFFDLDRDQELDYIRHTAGRHAAFPAGFYYATTSGELRHPSFVAGPEYNPLEKQWYQDGLRSQDFYFGPVYLDEDSQTNVVGASGVIKDRTGAVKGVAAADLYLSAISEIVSPVRLEQTGAMFLVDNFTNTIIGHKQEELVGATLMEQDEGMYPYVAELISSGATGLQTYRDRDGSRIYINLQAVPGCSWTAVAYVPRSEVMADLNALTRMIIALAAASVAVLFLLILALVRRVVIRPVKKLDYVARQIAGGRLDQALDHHSNDEFGQLARNFNKTVERLRDYVAYIGEISGVLEEIAQGNLDFRLTHEYEGEFAKVKTALENISSSLNSTLGQINEAADQVAGGSGQVASGAQALSQGATEQASAVEELAATVSEISSQVNQNAQYAQRASEQARSVGGGMLESKQQMQLLMDAMAEIGESSSEIGKIIKTIEDIAFQTNILALNAAVEAARAGAAGKGFAVVASEVRNLAGKSTQASKSTAELIGKSVRAITNGAGLAGQTAQSLLAAVEGAREVADTVSAISVASAAQAEAVAQVTLGIDQISAVVQTNSATAEQSAAASAELNGQARVMKDLVGGFRLREPAARPHQGV